MERRTLHTDIEMMDIQLVHAKDLLQDADIDDIRNQFIQIRENLPVLQKDRFKLLNRLHRAGRYTAWLIGEILIEEEKKIYANVERWMKAGEVPEQKPAITSLYDLFNQYGDEIGFSYKTARQYIIFAKTTDVYTAVQLGTKIVNEVRKIKDVKMRENILQEAKENSYKYEFVKQKVNSILLKQKEKENKKEEIKTIESVITMDVNIAEDETTCKVTFGNREHRDAFVDYLYKNLLEIKKFIADSKK